MLQTISWKAYWVLIGLGVVFFYYWWLKRYYRGWPKRSSDPAEGKTAESGAFAEPTAMGAVVPGKAGQAEPADQVQAPAQPKPADQHSSSESKI